MYKPKTKAVKLVMVEHELEETKEQLSLLKEDYAELRRMYLIMTAAATILALAILVIAIMF